MAGCTLRSAGPAGWANEAAWRAGKRWFAARERGAGSASSHHPSGPGRVSGISPGRLRTPALARRTRPWWSGSEAVPGSASP